jgi:AraC-like DNA-binding protein
MSFPREQSFPLHMHSASHAILVYSGEWTDGVESPRRVGPGDLLFQPAGIEHETFAAAGTSVIILDFSASILAGFCGLYGFYPRTILISFDDIEQIPERIHAEMSHIDESTPAVIHSLVMQLVAVGSRAPIECNPRVPEWMPRLIAYIQANLGERLSISRLAARAAVSESQLSHSFVRYFNRSVSDYIRDCRLRAAARALRHTADPIQKIAWETGFSDQAHFCKAFKAARGVTPTEYRLTAPAPAADPVLARRREPIMACCVR